MQRTRCKYERARIVVDAVAFDTRGAEHVAAWQWVLSEVPQATEAGRMTDEVHSSTHMRVETVHVDMMKLSGNH